MSTQTQQAEQFTFTRPARGVWWTCDQVPSIEIAKEADGYSVEHEGESIGHAQALGGAKKIGACFATRLVLLAEFGQAQDRRQRNKAVLATLRGAEEE